MFAQGNREPNTCRPYSFLKEHKGIETPYGNRSKNKKRDIAKLSNGKADKNAVEKSSLRESCKWTN
jgi:hypothetical protein